MKHFFLMCVRTLMLLPGYAVSSNEYLPHIPWHQATTVTPHAPHMPPTPLANAQTPLAQPVIQSSNRFPFTYETGCFFFGFGVATALCCVFNYYRGTPIIHISVEQKSDEKPKKHSSQNYQSPYAQKAVTNVPTHWENNTPLDSDYVDENNQDNDEPEEEAIQNGQRNPLSQPLNKTPKKYYSNKPY
jgi:hypothetical protein